MKHLTAAEVLAVRDGEDGPSTEEHRSHLEACASCREAVDAARLRAKRVEAALPPGPDLSRTDLDVARARVRARLGAGSGSGSRGADAGRERRVAPPVGAWGGLGSLARAAGLVLLLAGGAAAFPGSPVREWLDARFGESTVAVAPATEAEAETAAAAPAETGIRLLVESGPVEVGLRGLAPGDRVVVERADGPELAVFAPDGSRFRSADGGVEAEAAGGPVRVRLPSGVAPVTLRVDGRVWLRWTEAGAATPGPLVEDDAGRLVFEVPR